jgi:hypothetical protein
MDVVEAVEDEADGRGCDVIVAASEIGVAVLGVDFMNQFWL